MKRCIAVLMLASIPVLLMARVFQAYLYAVLVEEAGDIERLQQDRLEENKRLIAGIAVFSAPQRVFSIAKGELNLRNADSEKVLHIRIPEKSENGL